MKNNIEFRNLGRKKQHQVSLFEMAECDADIAKISKDETPGPADIEITRYATQAREFLKTKGFEDPYGYFRVTDEKVVVKCDYAWKPLWSAIQERDELLGGQTGEYLAAMVLAKNALYETAKWDFIWNKNIKSTYVMQCVAMEIQCYFSYLYLYEIVQSQYSAGKSRVDNANAEKRKLKDKFEDEIMAMYRESEIQEPTIKKLARREKILKELQKRHPDEEIPASETIRKW